MYVILIKNHAFSDLSQIHKLEFINKSESYKIHVYMRNKYDCKIFKFNKCMNENTIINIILNVFMEKYNKNGQLSSSTKLHSFFHGSFSRMVETLLGISPLIKQINYIPILKNVPWSVQVSAKVHLSMNIEDDIENVLELLNDNTVCQQLHRLINGLKIFITHELFYHISDMNPIFLRQIINEENRLKYHKSYLIKKNQLFNTKKNLRNILRINTFGYFNKIVHTMNEDYYVILLKIIFHFCVKQTIMKIF